MRYENDRLLGAAGHDGHDVPKGDRAEVCEIFGPDVRLCDQSEGRDRLAVPPGRTLGLDRAWNARGVLGR